MGGIIRTQDENGGIWEHLGEISFPCIMQTRASFGVLLHPLPVAEKTDFEILPRGVCYVITRVLRGTLWWELRSTAEYE